MRQREIIASAIIIGVLLIIALAFFVQSNSGSGCGCGVPQIVVHRVNDTAINLTLVDRDGTSSIKGLTITSPVIASPEAVSPNEELTINRTMTITDPALKKPTSLVATSLVDGAGQVVIDTNV